MRKFSPLIRSMLLFAAALLPLKCFSDPSNPTTAGKKYIRTITVKCGAIFEDKTGFPYGTANAIKSPTEEDVIRRELNFREGDIYDPFLVEESARNLRLQKYLRDVKITPTVEGDAVDLVVEARDSWTLIPYLNYSMGTGRKSRGIGLSESNLNGRAEQLELRYQEQDTRQSYGLLYSDPQFLATRQRLSLGAFERSDGTVYQFGYGLPFRSLKQIDGWMFDGSRGDTIGRLYEAGDEEYIFRQQNEEFSALYTFAGPTLSSDPQILQYSGIYKGQKLLSNRFSVGYSYKSDVFQQADSNDYADLDLDPNVVSNDALRLADMRRFSGPVLQYQNIQPNFVTLNYIDRFDRNEDYNLGDETLVNLHFAPRTLGSSDNVLLLATNRSRGWTITDHSYLRAEMGGSTRFQKDSLENSLVRAEAKYYALLGDAFVGETFLGRHTLASQFFIDFGDDLDRDRQLLMGADNGLRAYKVNTFEGDKRISLNIEERSHLADDVLQLISLGTAVFLDVGGTTRDALSTLVTDDMYADIGFGFRVGFPRASGGGVVRLDIALPLREGPDGSGVFEPRIVVGAGQVFGSRLRSEQVGAENASVGVGFDR